MRKRKRERRGGGRSEGALRQGRAEHTHGAGSLPACACACARSAVGVATRHPKKKRWGGTAGRSDDTTAPARSVCTVVHSLSVCKQKAANERDTARLVVVEEAFSAPPTTPFTPHSAASLHLSAAVANFFGLVWPGLVAAQSGTPASALKLAAASCLPTGLRRRCQGGGNIVAGETHVSCGVVRCAGCQL